ncbi:hypothetical protein [Chryseosolibacter indicus]|uniref:DNA repair ATPase n=1 Tax=Chryseosolibacter indicus TaxID=2782351 RepID=A0ABS5VSP8_9BACT|nr:hypothetical protein [Chryseosolibacter indicus]MBT1704376.1 hypothetical protein [Chryseosolibacter indicus]
MKTCFFVGFIFLSFITTAQNIKVNKESIQIKGEAAEGFEIELDGTLHDVEAQFLKFLKPVGKPKKTTEGYVITPSVIGEKNYASPIYAVVRDKGSGSAWIGVLPSEWPSTVEDVKKDVEKLVHDFGASFYRDKVQQQIDESNRALQAVQKQQQRLVGQNKDLGNKLEQNKQEKLKLDKQIENNSLEFESLTKKIEKNKKDQDSVANAGEQIKRVIEMQKLKQSNIN